MVKHRYLLAFALTFTLAPTLYGQTQKLASGSEIEPPVAPKRASSTSNLSGEERPISKNARDSARRYYKAGVKYGRANLFKQALQSFQEAVKLDPQSSEAYLGLGQAYLDLGLFHEAVGAFEKVVKLSPNDLDGYAGLGEAYARLREKEGLKETKVSSQPAAEPVGLNAKGSSPETAVNANSPEPTQPDLTGIYKVGIGDVLDIRIPGLAGNASTLFTVSSTGAIEHPILGEPMRVLDLTTNEISNNIGTELRRRSMGTANPEVGVRDYNSHTVLVSGLVKEPGTKVLRREAIPLYVVLADAQPLPDAAAVTVISRHGPQTLNIGLANPSQTSLLILPGDVVNVTAAVRQFFYVGGAVRSPGEFSFHPGLTLTQAILSAGGLSAKGDKVRLTRGEGNGLLNTQQLKLKDIDGGKIPDPLIEPGDRIVVLP